VLASPIGNEVARIESGPGGAVLHIADGESHQAESFAVLTERILGVGLDPAALAAWLHGQPPAEGLGPEWRVTIDESQQAGAVTIARRMSATSGDVLVRLFVDSYRALGE
jgi:outer membrane biogenesis lipoprotein LolB